ncbi:MAG: 30S ribosome-binding factor RbfA [Oscillospiraceae bacterium]|nr:30S ribosome-binding factor RbfA [Oscillospiraceae bacterium]
MSTNRINRINEDIRAVLAELLPRVKDPRVNQGMLSITRVDTTGDLRWCKVFVSVLGEADLKELKRGLKSAAPWLRHELGQKLTLRYTPELLFETDDSIAHGAHIARLLSELDAGEKPEEDGETNEDA